MTRARFASFAREAEQDDIGRRRSPGEDPVALHFVLEPASVLGSEVQLEEQLERFAVILEPGEAIRSNVSLPGSSAPCLATPFGHPNGVFGRPRDVAHAGEEAVCSTRVPEPGTVDECPFPVVAVADLA